MHFNGIFLWTVSLCFWLRQGCIYFVSQFEKRKNQSFLKESSHCHILPPVFCSAHDRYRRISSSTECRQNFFEHFVPFKIASRWRWEIRSIQFERTRFEVALQWNFCAKVNVVTIICVSIPWKDLNQLKFIRSALTIRRSPFSEAYNQGNKILWVQAQNCRSTCFSVELT